MESKQLKLRLEISLTNHSARRLSRFACLDPIRLNRTGALPGSFLSIEEKEIVTFSIEVSAEAVAAIPIKLGRNENDDDDGNSY